MAGIPQFIRLEIVTPERQVQSEEEVTEVTIPGSEGYLGVLPGHLPLLTTIGIGVLTFRKGSKKFTFSVSGGFAEVLADRVIIMAQTLERPEEIDVQRARSARERAEKQLASRDVVDVEQAMGALLRATSRMRVAEMK